MIRLICVLCLAALASIPAVAQPRDTLTVNTAVEVALANNTSLRVSAARMQGADARSREAQSALLPTVKFEAGYRRLSDVAPFSVQLPIMPSPIVISPTVLDNYSLRASVQQPLFTGFKLQSNARAAELLAEAARTDRLADAAEVTLAARTAYWVLYQTRETRKFLEENVVRLESYTKDVQKLLESGMATRNDLLRVEVQLANARLSLIDAANDAEVAQMSLNVAMGAGINRTWVLEASPAAEIPVTGYHALNADSLSVNAFAARSDIKAIEYRLDAARSSARAAEGNWWPQLFLSGSYYYNRPNSRIMPTLDQFKDTWDVGVTLQFDVWNWGATARQVDQARATVQQQEAVLVQVRENVAFEVRRQLLARDRAAAKADVGRLAVQQAEENVRTLQEKFRSGLATSTELLDADVALLQAKTSHTAALVEQLIARARLTRATGASE